MLNMESTGKSVKKLYKRKLELKEDCSDPDIDLVTLSDNKSSASKYSKSDKLSFFHTGVIDKSKDGKLLDILSIKTEVHSLTHTADGCKRILDKHQSILSKRALGADISYVTKTITTSRGTREVLVKQPFMANIPWAKAVRKSGGGGSSYSVIERIVLIGAAYVITIYYRELKMDPSLGILAVGNMGKLYRIYVIIMVILKYGDKYPEYVARRTKESV